MNNKRLMKVLGVLIAMALLAAVLPMQAKAETPPLEVWVDDSFPSEDPTHFKTINGGINAVAVGGKVNVAAGTYNENLVVNKALSLLGAGDEVVTVTGVNPTTDAGMVNIQASNVTIDGFKFVGAGYKTVRITQPTSNVTFSNNYVVGAEYTSGGGWILLETNYGVAQTNLTITGNTFENNGSQIGVYINPTHPSLEVSSNTFLGDSTSGPVLGIDQMDGNEVITGNNFTDITSPYALFEGFGTVPIVDIFNDNTWPAGYIASGKSVVPASVVYPSTNEQNRINNWGHVDFISADAVARTITLKFFPSNILNDPWVSCFERRTDGDTSQNNYANGGVNWNAEILDGLYPYNCYTGNTTPILRTYSVIDYIEIRLSFGPEKDERFYWTRFDLIDEVWVDDGFTSETPGWGVDHFAVIQDGIDAVATNGIVHVAAGTYAENLTIDKPLTLQGAGSTTTTVTGVAPAGDAGVLRIMDSNVTVQGFKFVAIGAKTIRITDPTSNVIIRNNHIVGAENEEPANNFTLLETDYNETQTMHVITGNIFEADGAAQAVYYNPSTHGLIFTDNTFTGTIKDGGVGFVVDALSSYYDISGNDFTALGGNPYAMMGLPGLTAPEMDEIFLANDFPIGYAVVGTDIMIPSGTIGRDPGNTGDVLGGTPLEEEIVGDTITFLGEVAWYPEDEALGRTAGNRVGVQITAPAGFDTADTTFTINDSEPYTWDEVNDGDNYVWIYPLVTEAGQSWEIVVTWVEGAEQTFTVVVDEDSTLQDPIIGTIERDPGNTGDVLGETPLEEEIVGDTITFLGEVAWYPEDEALDRTAGNRVGVEINAPAGYNTAYTTFTAFGNTYNWDVVKDGDNFVWIYPLVTTTPQEWDIVVTWQPGVEQTFTVKVLTGSTLQDPIIGTIEPDGGTGQVLGGEPLVITSENDVVSYLGEIAWYPADEALGRTAGNRVGVEINAPAGYNTAYTTFTAFGNTYNWDEVNDGENFVWIYPKVTEVPQSWNIVVTWQPGVTQTFTVEVLEDSSLQDPIIGTIERDPGDTGDVLGGDPLDVVVAGDTVTFSGEVAWYPEDEALGRTAGNRVGVEINAPAGYNTAYTTFTINDSEPYTWDEVNDGDNYVWIYPLVTEAGQSWNIVVTWQPGVTQTFTVEVLEGSTLDVPPYVISATAFGVDGFEDVPAEDLIFTVDQGYTVDYIEITMNEDVTVAEGTIVSFEGEPYGTITADGEILTVTPYPGNEVAAMLGEFTFSIPEGSVTNSAGNSPEILSATLIVNNVAPVALDDEYTVVEDNDLVVDAPGVLVNDSDFDPTVLIAVLDIGPDNGTLELAENGSFVYTPDEDFFGDDSFTYTAFDGNDNSEPATVTITVTPVKDQVVAVDDEYETDEDAALTIEAPGVLANDIEVDLNVMAAGLVTGVENGILTLNVDGSFTYIPDPDFSGTDTFVYKLITYLPTPQDLWTDEATVTITVNPVADAPVLDLIEDATIPELVEFSFTATATDVDLPAQVLTFSLGDAPEGAAIDAETGVFTWTPSEEQGAGVYAFTVKVCDDTDPTPLCDEQEVTLTVTEVNAAPVAQDLTATTPEDIPVDVTLVASDAEDDELTYAIVAQPAHGTVTLDGDIATYTPESNFNGEDSFTYKASDGELESEPATVTITVGAVNDEPNAVDDEYDAWMGVTLEVPAPGVLENDIDPDQGDEQTVEVKDAPLHGVLVLNPDGSFTYEPAAGFHGIDTFTYWLTSEPGVQSAYLDSATVTITVRPVARIFLPIILK